MLLCQTTPDRDVKQSRAANKVIFTYPGRFMRQHFQPPPVSKGIPSGTKTDSFRLQNFNSGRMWCFRLEKMHLSDRDRTTRN